jgi:undecaprenyl-diphosphatase
MVVNKAVRKTRGSEKRDVTNERHREFTADSEQAANLQLELLPESVSKHPMPDWLSAVILGAIEGLTEFLPVSSTGHLLLAEQFLPKQTELFNVLIQSGAVLAVLVVFAERLKNMARNWREKGTQDYLLKLIVAFVITGIGGLLLKKAHWKLPEKPNPVIWATLLGGVLILVIESWIRGKPKDDTVTWTIALTVGLAQLAAAVFPGLSRSGATIMAALALGLSRPAATEFAFLLGIPTLWAAGGLEIYSALKHPEGPAEPWTLVLLGTLAATVTAFIAVKWLLQFVQSHTFVVFGWYRIALGAAMLVLFWR